VSHATGLEFANNATSPLIYQPTNAYNAHTTAVFAPTQPTATITAPRTTLTIPPPDNVYQLELKESLWDYSPLSAFSSISFEQ